MMQRTNKAALAKNVELASVKDIDLELVMELGLALVMRVGSELATGVGLALVMDTGSPMEFEICFSSEMVVDLALVMGPLTLAMDVDWGLVMDVYLALTSAASSHDWMTRQAFQHQQMLAEQ